MSVLYSSRAKEVLAEAEKIAKETGGVLGAPHVMKAIMQTNDFKSSYPDEGDSYKELKLFVDHYIKTYKPTKAIGDKGFDWYLIEENVFKAIHKFTKMVVPSSTIMIAHMFLGVCANTEYFRLEDFLESYGINKADLFIKIATYQE